MMPATSSTAAGLGRLVMITGASRATCGGIGGDDDAGLRQLRRARAASISKPITRQPRSTRLRADRASHDAEADHSNGLVS